MPEGEDGQPQIQHEVFTFIAVNYIIRTPCRARLFSLRCILNSSLFELKRGKNDVPEVLKRFHGFYPEHAEHVTNGFNNKRWTELQSSEWLNYWYFTNFLVLTSFPASIPSLFSRRNVARSRKLSTGSCSAHSRSFLKVSGLVLEGRKKCNKRLKKQTRGDSLTAARLSSALGRLRWQQDDGLSRQFLFSARKLAAGTRRYSGLGFQNKTHFPKTINWKLLITFLT